MNASIIVPVWNGLADLPECLDAALAQIGSEDELVVVDNHSDDGSADLVAARYPRVIVLRQARNLGFAAGCNVGLSAAHGDLLVLLNQDTIVRPGWLDALRAALSEPGVGMAGALAFYPDGRVQHAGGVINTRGEGAHRIELADPDPDYVSGASLAVSRACSRAIGMLDEGFGLAYFEDADWCYRARAAGFRVVMAPGARLVHKERSAAAARADHAYAFHRNRMRFVLKHWSVDRLRDEFEPAERQWLQQLPDGGETLVASMHRIYAECLLGLSGLPGLRLGAEQAVYADIATIAGVLVSLCEVLPLPPVAAVSPIRLDLPARVATNRDAAAAMADLMRAPNVAHERVSNQPWVLQEPGFRSRMPLIGGLIVAFRTVFNQISTRWYVLELMQQQSIINLRLAIILDDVLKQIASLAESVAAVRQTSASLSADFQAEVDALDSRVSDLAGRTVDAIGALSARQAGRDAEQLRLLRVLSAYLAEQSRQSAELARRLGERRGE